MGLFTRTFFIAILFLGISSTWGTSEENSSAPKISKALFPKKYQPMSLKKYRLEPTEISTTISPEPEGTTTGNPTETSSSNPEDIDLEDLTESEEETFLKAMGRTRKSATTTFCVEIRPSNPYQKPFQVCEPASPNYNYGYRPHKLQPRPIKYHQQPSYGHQPSYGQEEPVYQPAYVSQPAYGPQPSYGGQPQQPELQPEPQPLPQGSGDGYERPVMVLPHVPVAEPYHVPSHVPKPAYKPSNGGGVYRSSGGWGVDDIEAEEGLDANMEGRSAYYNPYDSYGDDKTTLYDYHKKKELSYIPIMTHSYKKTKPMKFLKVLKDLKKDKYKIEDDDYYRPMYYHQPSYEHQDSGYENHKEGGSSHGLVITCQPSAVGYTGQQNQLELSKHMDLLKNIYAQSEKLYNQQTLSSNPGSDIYGGGGGGGGGGYVVPGTYRSAGGDWNKAEGTMRKGGWDKAEADENLRKSGGWEKNQAEPNLRSSGGGKWNPSQMDEQKGTSLASSAGPNPTVGMMHQKEMEATASVFRNVKNNLAMRDMQNP